MRRVVVAALVCATCGLTCTRVGFRPPRRGDEAGDSNVGGDAGIGDTSGGDVRLGDSFEPGDSLEPGDSRGGDEQPPPVLRSCQELLDAGYTEDGIYTLDTDDSGARLSYSFECDQTTDEGGWTRVFKQDEEQFSSVGAALSQNLNSPNDAKRSLLFLLDDLRSGDGSFLFRLTWGGHAERNIWLQSTNPTEDITVGGYTAVSVELSDSGWGGLELGNGAHGPANGNAALLDGSIDDAQWWYAVGTTTGGAGGGIPASPSISAPQDTGSVQSVKLWVREVRPSNCSEALLWSGQSTGFFVIDPDGFGGAPAVLAECP